MLFGERPDRLHATSLSRSRSVPRTLCLQDPEKWPVSVPTHEYVQQAEVDSGCLNLQQPVFSEYFFFT
jgi:hypothetical protein